MNFEGKDYYNKLGIDKSSSLDQIRKAYLREKYDNPYVRVWDQKELDEAYDVLSNVEKRKAYDDYLNDKKKKELNDVSNQNTNNDFNEVKDKDNANNSVDINNQERLTTEEEKNNNFSDGSENNSMEQNSQTRENSSNIPTDEQNVEQIDNKSPEKETQNEKEKSKSKDSEFIIVPINRKLKNGKLYKVASTKFKSYKTKYKKFAPVLGVGVGTFLIVSSTSTISIAVLGSVAAGMVYKKINNTKLVKNFKSKYITKISTEEANLIEKYRENLDNQIYKLLSESHNNYSLEIALLKYNNQIELLKERIKFKKNMNIDKCSKIKYKLELASLKLQLEKMEKKKVKIEDQIKNYTGESSLSKLNSKISDKEKEIKQNEEKNVSKFEIKKLNIRKNRLLKVRDSEANMIKLYNSMKGRVIESPSQIINGVKKYKEIFTPVEDVENETYSKIL